MIAAEWALPGAKSYPKRPIGYRTRAELGTALQASGLLAPPFERRRSQEDIYTLPLPLPYPYPYPYPYP